jgi:hypothetical protein
MRMAQGAEQRTGNYTSLCTTTKTAERLLAFAPAASLSRWHRVACGRGIRAPTGLIFRLLAAHVPHVRYAASLLPTCTAGTALLPHCSLLSVLLGHAALCLASAAASTTALDVEDGQFHVAIKRPIRSSQ